MARFQVSYSGKNLSSDQVRNSYIQTAYQVATGYAGGKAIDTNSNPNNLQTAGTVFVSAMVGGLIYQYALKSMLKDNSTALGFVEDNKGNTVLYTNPATLAMRVLSGYHGYKRNNDNIGYGVLWAIFGSPTTFGLALEQGFGQELPQSRKFLPAPLPQQS